MEISVIERRYDPAGALCELLCRKARKSSREVKVALWRIEPSERRLCTMMSTSSIGHGVCAGLEPEVVVGRFSGLDGDLSIVSCYIAS